MKNLYLKYLFFFYSSFFSLIVFSKNDLGGKELSYRLLGDASENFIFKQLDSNDKMDVFELESADNKIIISGNTGVAQASGLNYYLEQFCNIQLSVNNFSFRLPDSLPMIKGKIRKESKYEYRYIFNYCTFGYTMPWWDWNRWEKMIDYMALKGVNMPLSIIAQEVVWKEVYKELGMSEEQISETFVGPAHLPWHWMGNIDGLGGPLPEKWFKDRLDLQKKILARERQLGMRPVMQSFTGHVPVALKKLYPQAKIEKIEDWAGVEGTYFLDPTDPLFNRIGSLYLQKQTEMFGSDHLYDADCFIEVDPPSNNPDFLKKLSSSVYNIMKKEDPHSIWVTQGWFLFFRRKFWQDEQVKAFFSGVPKGKMLVLDLYGEKNPVWDWTNGFYGQDWIWNVICNGDQKLNMSGDLNTMQKQLYRAETSEHSKGLKGIGIIPEGIGYNDPVYDFIYSRAWNNDTVNIGSWLSNWAERRYGMHDDRIKKAWNLLAESVYARTRTRWSSLMSMPRMSKFDGEKEDIRHERADISIKSSKDFDMDLDVPKLAKAAKILLSLSDKLKRNEAYEFDLVNVYRELLHSFSHLFIGNLTRAYEDKNLTEFDISSSKLLKLFDDLESITSSNKFFMVGPWIQSARNWGDNICEKDYYERNARTILTIWQPYKKATLRDYASRQWSGMIKDYYKPRWELLCLELRNCIVSGDLFDVKAYENTVKELDFAWTIANKPYPSTPYTNPIDVAFKIWQDYSFYFD